MQSYGAGLENTVLGNAEFPEARFPRMIDVDECD